jgi:phosphate transport system permease protein
MASWRDTIRRGDPAVWFAGAGLGVCLLMITGMLVLILVNGLGFFWPKPVEQITLADGSVLLGEVVRREGIPKPGTAEHLQQHRIQVRTGNRDLNGSDFRWIDEADIAKRERPADVVYLERREYGPFIGRLEQLTRGDRSVASGHEATWVAVQPLVGKAARDRDAIRSFERGQVGRVNHDLERERLALKRLEMASATEPGRDTAGRREAIERAVTALQAKYDEVEARLTAMIDEASSTRVTLRSVDGETKDLPTLDIFRAYAPNQLSTLGRARVYASRLWGFVSDEPRESNTEGGVFPAIFGTVLMVLIMSILAVPFGVLTALYLREYAKQGPLVRAVRIAVNNLAGVPSIVFGVFGLGFFVYFVGGGLDRLFFAEKLPTPTFGTGGILWASLTLGLLTIPVVVVAAEEALAAVPRSMREASLATGATKFQTIMRVVLPAAAPGILTGLILAMARGAGEVAPLMITGVVKLAPDLPLDGEFPFLHLERKFMHLGFHIYDVGFQSPNVEAAKPMVYATSILLLLIVVLLNLTAIVVRNRLRKKYQASAF